MSHHLLVFLLYFKVDKLSNMLSVPVKPGKLCASSHPLLLLFWSRWRDQLGMSSWCDQLWWHSRASTTENGLNVELLMASVTVPLVYSWSTRASSDCTISGCPILTVSQFSPHVYSVCTWVNLLIKEHILWNLSSWLLLKLT